VVITPNRARVEVAHQRIFVCGDQWAVSTTVDGNTTGGQSRDRDMVFDTEL